MIHQILLTVPIFSTFTTAGAFNSLDLQTRFGMMGGGHGWSYGSGVEVWTKKFPGCAGSSQSPISLEEDMAKKIPLHFLKWGNMNTTPINMYLTNTGHTVVLRGLWHYHKTPYIELSHTGHKFTLDEVHWHWGNGAHDGTEHEVEGRRAALEMHMVFNKVYGKGNAYKLVYGHMFEHDNQPSAVPPGIYTVANYLEEETFKLWPFMYRRVMLRPAFTAGDLIHPQPTSVFFYSGSMTTPPCSEPVLWLVAAQTGSVSDNEMNAFRRVKGRDDENMAGNVRPLQPRNGRKYHLFAANDTHLSV